MRRSLLATLVGVVAIATACGGSNNAPAAAATPYRVLMILGTSGALAQVGQAEVLAFNASANVLNKSGGINGHKIVVDVQDDQGDPTKGNSILIEKINGGTPPDLVFPGTSSSETLAMLPTLTKNKLLSFGNGASPNIFSQPTVSPYSFSTAGKVAGGGGPAFLAKYLSSKGYKKAGLLFSNDANGQAQLSQHNDAIKAAGLTTVTQSFAPTGLDFSPQLEQLRGQNPDVLVVSAFGTAAGTILKNRQTIGWSVPVVGDPSTAANDLYTLAGAPALTNVTLEAFHLTKYLSPDQMPKGQRTMFDAIKAQGPITQSLTLYSFSYDILQVVATASKQANSLDPVKVTKALETLKTPNPAPWVALASYGFSADYHGSTETEQDIIFIPAGQLVDGMIKPA